MEVFYTSFYTEGLATDWGQGTLFRVTGSTYLVYLYIALIVAFLPAGEEGGSKEKTETNV